MTKISFTAALRRHLPEWITHFSVDVAAEGLTIYLESSCKPGYRHLERLWAEVRHGTGERVAIICEWSGGTIEYPTPMSRPFRRATQSGQRQSGNNESITLLEHRIQSLLPRDVQLWNMSVHDLPLGNAHDRLVYLRLLPTNGARPDTVALGRSIEREVNHIVSIHLDRITPAFELQLYQVADAQGLIRDTEGLTRVIRSIQGGTPTVNRKVAAARAASSGRINLRGDCYTSWDPARTKEFDDAVHSKEIGGGAIRVSTAYTDVTDFVRPDSPAFARARDLVTSFYGRWTAVALLGEECMQMASLREGMERAAWISSWTVDRDGTKRDRTIERAWIVNRRNLTLDDAASGSFRGDGAVQHNYELTMEAAARMRAARFPGRGVGELRPEDVVAEGAISAKTGLALHCSDKGIPILYRTFNSPSPARMERLLHRAHDLGLEVAAEDLADRHRLHEFIDVLRTEGHFQLERDLIESFYGMARNDTLNEGHRGLNSPAHMRFSALRDYSAVLNQCQMDAYWRGESLFSPQRMEAEARHIRRKIRVSLEHYHRLLTAERIHAGLSLRESIFEATATSVRDGRIRAHFDAAALDGPALELFAGKSLIVRPPGHEVQEGERLALSIEGYQVGKKRFIFRTASIREGAALSAPHGIAAVD